MSSNRSRNKRNGSVRNRKNDYCSDAKVKSHGLRAVLAEKYEGSNADADLAVRWLDCEGASHEKYKEHFVKAIPGYLYDVKEKGGACICVMPLNIINERNYAELMAYTNENTENASKQERYFGEYSYLHGADSYLFMDFRTESLFTILRGGLGNFMGPYTRTEGNNARINSAYTDALLSKAKDLYKANPAVESLIDGGDLPFSEVMEANIEELTPQEALAQIQITKLAMERAMNLSAPLHNAVEAKTTIVEAVTKSDSKTESEATAEIAKALDVDLEQAENETVSAIVERVLNDIEQKSDDVAYPEDIRKEIKLLLSTRRDDLRATLIQSTKPRIHELNKHINECIAVAGAINESLAEDTSEHLETILEEEADGSNMNALSSMGGGAASASSAGRINVRMNPAQIVAEARKYVSELESGSIKAPDRDDELMRSIVSILNKRDSASTFNAPENAGMTNVNVVSRARADIELKRLKHNALVYKPKPFTMYNTAIASKMEALLKKPARAPKPTVLALTSAKLGLSWGDTFRNLSQNIEAIFQAAQEKVAEAALSASGVGAESHRADTNTPKNRILSKIWAQVDLALSGRPLRKWNKLIEAKIDDAFRGMDFTTGELAAAGAGAAVGAAGSTVVGPAVVGALGTLLGLTPPGWAVGATIAVGTVVGGAIGYGTAKFLEVWWIKGLITHYVMKIAAAYRFAAEVSQIRAFTEQIYNTYFTEKGEKSKFNVKGSVAEHGGYSALEDAYIAFLESESGVRMSRNILSAASTPLHNLPLEFVNVGTAAGAEVFNETATLMKGVVDAVISQQQSNSANSTRRDTLRGWAQTAREYIQTSNPKSFGVNSTHIVRVNTLILELGVHQDIALWIIAASGSIAADKLEGKVKAAYMKYFSHYPPPRLAADANEIDKFMTVTTLDNIKSYLIEQGFTEPPKFVAAATPPPAAATPPPAAATPPPAAATPPPAAATPPVGNEPAKAGGGRRTKKNKSPLLRFMRKNKTRTSY